MNKTLKAGLLMGLAALALPASVLAVPAMPGLAPFTQPDGTVVMLERCGDEHGYFFQDADGRVVMQETGGRFVYALAGDDADSPFRSSGIAAGTALSADQLSLLGSRRQVLATFQKGVDTRKMEVLRPMLAGAVDDTPVGAVTNGSAMRFGTKQLPVNGAPKVLVALVQFQDIKFSTENPAEYYDYWCNDTEGAYPGCQGSVNRYFYESSYGDYDPQFVVVGPVTVSQDSKFYGQDIGSRIDVNLEELVRETAQLMPEALKSKGLSLSDFDNNMDNILDALVMIYAGEGQSMCPNTDNIWSATSYLVRANAASKLYVDGLLIDGYSATCELTSRPGSGNNGQHNCITDTAGPGVFVHEYAHLMGLPDWYCTNYGGTKTPGNWSVMDAGPYLGEKYTGCPPLFSSYEGYCMDWITPREVVTSIGQVSLGYRTKEAVVVPMESRRNEFYMMETRTPEGWDQCLAGSGLMIWHVDFQLQYWTSNTVNNDKEHPRCDLVRAKADSEALNLWGGRSRAYEFSDQTSPAFQSWNATPSPVYLYDIKYDSSSKTTTMRIVSSAGIDDIVADDTTDSSLPVEYFTLQGQRVEEPAQGLFIRRQGSSVKKVIL